MLEHYLLPPPYVQKEVKACGLGTPKPFFQVMRYIVIANEMQRDIGTPVERIALRYRFHDASACRHRMLEVLGQRPKDVRRWLGFEWFLDSGLRRAGLASR